VKFPQGRRLLRWLVRALAVLLLALLALGLLYKVVIPPSTPMLARWLRGQPVDRRVVALAAISPHLIELVITSEDAHFCRHHGVDWDELQQVIRDGAQRGASTIAMQSAKNVFLWQEPAIPRKLIEIPLALALDALWGKSRTLEVYLNIAEWDEGVFGAEAAARHHFGKRARDLTRREAALLATALPAPQRRDPANPSAGHRRLAEDLLARAGRAGELSGCLDN